MSPEKIKVWNELIQHCLANNSAKPSATWLKTADSLVEELGPDLLRQQLLTFLPVVKEKRTEPASDNSESYNANRPDYISQGSSSLLRSLAWIARRFPDDEMSRTLRELAVNMYKKVYGFGMRNAKIGNAAVLSLSEMSGAIGLREVVILRAVTKYSPALVNINRIFDKLAQARNMSADELAEIATPDYGLTEIGSLKQKFGDFEMDLRLTGIGKTQLTWSNGKKIQKSIPAAVKETFAEDLKVI